MPMLSDFQVAEPESMAQDNPSPAVMEPPPLVDAELGIDSIAQHPWEPVQASFPTLADRGAGVEQFRALRSHVYQARYEAPLKSILIASGLPSEGKSFVAANLAMSLARNSIHKILLIDGDLRRPSLHTLLGAPNSVGLADYLEGSADVHDILQRNRDHSKNGEQNSKGIANLALIPSGKSADHSTELVAGERMKELIRSVSPYFDWIIIDAPPVLAVTDAVEISRAADAVMLVARGGQTTYDVAQRTQSAFGNSRILGFVLNDVKNVPNLGTYRYGNYYGTDSDAGGQMKRGRDNGR